MNKELSNIFISHRYADKAIADALKYALKSWGNGQIRVCQSSDVREKDAKIGGNLSGAQRTALSHNNVMILIYTITDNEWFYCMWECGIATNKNGKGTKLIVFKCGSDLPISLREQIPVTNDEESIKKFTNDFHKDTAFFSGRGEALDPEIDDKKIDARSNDLLNRLHGVDDCQYGTIR